MDWGIAASVATVVSAPLTLLSVIVAAVAIRQVRNLEREKSQPSIAVSIDRNAAVPWVYELVVQNMGQTEARDVRIVVKKTHDAGQAGEHDLPITPKVWPVLVPGQVWRSTWGTLDQHGTGVRENAVTDVYRAVVTYKGIDADERGPATFDLDWGMFYRRRYIDEKTVHHVANNVAEMNKKLTSLLKQMAASQAD